MGLKSLVFSAPRPSDTQETAGLMFISFVVGSGVFGASSQWTSGPFSALFIVQVPLLCLNSCSAIFEHARNEPTAPQ